MQREIIGFHRDHANDWVAELDCGHGQHVRNKPPFTNRPWVVTQAGRERHLGSILQCVRCDRLEMPEDVEPCAITPEYTEHSIPADLLCQHATQRGVWGQIVVCAGMLACIFESDELARLEIEAGQTACIPPLVVHRVVPKGTVRFHITAYARPAQTPCSPCS